MDVSMRTTCSRNNFSLDVKKRTWLNNFGNNPCGKCFYCDEWIILPKILWKKILNSIDKKIVENFVNSYIKEKNINHLEYSHFDHFKPDNMYGGSDIDNCLIICGICNLMKSNKLGKKFVLDREKRKRKRERDDSKMDIDTSIGLEERCTSNKKCKKGINLRCNKKVVIFDKCDSHLGEFKIYKNEL